MGVPRNENSALSIVVPIFRMAGKLQNLEKSLSNSIGLPVDFILVHDGNDRDTSAELDIIAKKFSVKILNVNVYSPGIARNEGMKSVRTPWVAFWDSDDVGYAAAIINELKVVREKINCIIGGYSRVNGLTKKKARVKEGKTLEEVFVNPGIWRFAFRVAAFKDLKFPHYRMGEDQVMLAKLNLSTDEIAISPENFYDYYSGSDAQLTANMFAVAEVQKSLENIELIVQDFPSSSNLILVMRSRLLITCFKHGYISKRRFASNFLGLSAPSLRQRMRIIRVGLITVKFIIKQWLSER